MTKEISPGTVSVVIACFNHGSFLGNAIESLLKQTCQAFEIIVIDDGSTDNTKQVCAMYPEVQYVYQQNQGLSAARNTGNRHALGDYIVHLDADDWLLEQALEINAGYLQANPEAVFVSGGFELYYEPERKIWPMQREISAPHYNRLLEGNYIGMHAAVMYRKMVFQSFHYDPEYRYCEDYDLYLRVARKHPVVHHTGLMAVYRLHGNNLSGNSVMMLDYVLKALQANEPLLANAGERESYTLGIQNWCNYYTDQVYKTLLSELYTNPLLTDKSRQECLQRYNIPLYNQFIQQKKDMLQSTGLKTKLKFFVKKTLPFLVKSEARPLNLGDLNRTTPLSERFGYDRGGPVDRYYIENFLLKNRSLIKGRTLEIGDNAYTLRYGVAAGLQSEVLHIDDSNPEATYIGDLTAVPQIPSNSFDCIILTQTLHLIYNYKAALESCYRLLKPGGVLLLTVPGISHIAQDDWGKYWLWSFTDNAMQRIFEELFPGAATEIETFGNVLVATAFLYGMGLPELSKEQINYHDPHYQVIIAVKAVKH